MHMLTVNPYLRIPKDINFFVPFLQNQFEKYPSQYHVITMVHGERNFLTKVNFLSYTLNYAKTSLVNHKKVTSHQ